MPGESQVRKHWYENGDQIDQIAEPLAINMHKKEESNARPTNAGMPLSPELSSISVSPTAMNFPCCSS